MAEFTTQSEHARVMKVNDELGLVFGFAVVSTFKGEAYYDSQGDHIPDDSMLKASVPFMKSARAVKEMHRGEAKGQVVFAFPLTAAIAKSLGIETKRTGLLIGMQPSEEAFAKFKDGTYTGFSIGGNYITNEAAA